MLWPAPLRGRACYTPLQALLHYALWHAPLRAPPIAHRLAGVSRQLITPAVSGAMRMSAKPPIRLSWRGLSPRGRDTPAPLRAGRAGARPGRGRYVTHATALRAAAPYVTFRRHSRYVTQATALRAACRIGGGWRLLTASSPAVGAVCAADVPACAAAARCPPPYPSAPATLPLRSRLARATREHTAVRGRTRGVYGGAGCPTERGVVTSSHGHGI